MRILLLTNHFHPEEFRCNDLAFALAERGHKVKVLTAIPDYPQGKFHKGYSFIKRRIEHLNGVDIIRVPIIPRGNGGTFRMVLNYASSIASLMIYGIWQAIFHKYDAVYVHDTSPAFVCLPALVVKAIRRTPVTIWILDMWPDSLIAGGIKSKKIYSSVGTMMKFIYRHADRLQISSLGFRKLLEDRGVEASKIEYFPNWSDTALTSSAVNDDIVLPDGFKVMFAGNLGEAQNLENVLKTAHLLKDKSDIKWIFLGDGRKKEWMEDYIKKHDLSQNVFLLGRHPIEEMPSFFTKADVMLVSLNNEHVFNNTLPAKVQAYMSSAKPILGFLNGEGQMIIGKANCGLTADASDIEGFAKKVLQIRNMSIDERKMLGDNGYEFYQQEFRKDMLINRLESLLFSLKKS